MEDKDFVVKVMRFIDKNQLLKSEDRVVIGLSGGVDSVALLLTLHQMTKNGHYPSLKIFPIHIHHGIRLDANEDVVFCEKLCASLGLSLKVIYVNVPDIGKKLKISDEEAGRILRYEAFKNYKEEVGARRVAVAHHMDDQLETVLHRFIRGSGLLGLGGMAALSNGVIRPLLEVTKEDINKYVASEGTLFMTDYTNFETIYTRNKLRLLLIPLIKEEFNGNIVQSVYKMSQIFQLNEDYLEQQAGIAFEEVCLTQLNLLEEPEQILLDIKKLNRLHPALLQRVMRLSIAKLKGDLNNVEYNHIERMIDLISLQSGKKVDVCQGIIASRSYDKLVLHNNKSEFNSLSMRGFSYSIDRIPDKGYIQEVELRYSIECLDFSNYKDSLKITQKLYTKCFDYDKMKANLVLRTRRPGDYIHIHKDGRSKTLKKLFIDEKIEESLRDQIPLLVMDNQVLWIVGYRVNPVYEVTTASKVILKVELMKEDIHGSEY